MNIKHAFLAILMGTSMLATTNQIACSQIIDEEEQEIDYEEEQENWFESYAAPCIAGGIVGSISGKISASICKVSLGMTAATGIITEDKVGQGIIGLAGLSAIIGTLIAENKLRAKCTDWLDQKFEGSRIQSNDLTKNSARIFSWITFLGIL